MPTYEYECRSCSHSFEAFQSMSEAPLSSCPECGGPVRRLIGGGTGIIFKGSGFYVNDSRKSSSASISSSPKAVGETATGASASGQGSASAPPASSPASPAKVDHAPAAKAAEPA